MKVHEIVKKLDSLAPLALQEGYDNAGLSVGDAESTVGSCLVCLDVTPEVIDEAAALGAGLVISHHPLIFREMKKITGRDPVGRIVMAAIQKGIALYAMHTNLDNVGHGVNLALAEKLGLVRPVILKPMAGQLRKLVTFCPVSHAEAVRQAIFGAGAGVIGNYDCCSFNAEGSGTFRAGAGASPFVGQVNELHSEPEVRIETILPAWLEKEVVKAMIAAHPYEEVAYDIYPLANVHPGVGAGMIGDLEQPVEEGEFFLHIKKTLNIPYVRHSGMIGKPVRKIAICGGAGGFLLNDAIASGADAFITGDLKYHQFFDARGRILLLDAGHFETEQFTTSIIAEYLNKIFPNFAVHISKVAVNPVNYL